jgi:hypothetical protein
MHFGALPDGRASAPHREPSGSNTQLPLVGTEVMAPSLVR